MATKRQGQINVMDSEKLTVGEIKEKSVSGAKWLLITNTLNVPAAFLMAFFLGRTSPEALGTFGLVQIFIATISTFVVFGGSTVLRNFMAKTLNPVDRGRLFFTYSLMLAALMIIMLAFFFTFPKVLHFFLRQEITVTTITIFAFFSLFVIASDLFSSANAGMMNIKISTISQTVTRLFPLPVITILFFFKKSFLEQNVFTILIVLYLFSYVCGTVISSVALFREKRFTAQTTTYIPKGFIPFCLSTHLATIFSFIYNDVDRIFMLQLGEMGGLGMYQAIVSINRLVQYIPVVVSAALVPLFSSLIANNDKQSIQKGYHYIQRYSTLIISFISLMIIPFSNNFLEIFGSGYSGNYSILALFSFTSIATSLFIGNTALLTSYEKNMFRLIVSSIQILIQIGGTFMFISRYGILAVAGFKMIGSIFAQMATIYYVVFKMKLQLKIPSTYYAGLIIGIISIIIKLVVVRENLLLSISLYTLSAIIFLLLTKINRNDILLLMNLMSNKRNV